MNQYLIDTEFAVQSLFDLVTHELNQINALEIVLNERRENARKIYSDAYYVTDLDGDDLETPEMYMRRNGYVQHASAAQKIQSEISKLEESYKSKDSSIRTLYGSILQIAKQGLSTVFRGSIQTAIIEPNTGEPIHNIILQGRNQSMHFEEGINKKPVKECFMKLQLAFGNDFDLNIGDNKAKFVVVDALGWRTYHDYLTTMNQLLP
ncbi:hypothetical protein [Lysinibacillus irui]|uniref:hypothetical protein n=1 Tax=Lysinibacillus irui TaxID=2998077 RepID=UPI002AD24ABF|nr:hypothetical protein [Lysinibacillus irui]MEA0565283.1 hypothetical protein [Lysinibacillus irui]